MGVQIVHHEVPSCCTWIGCNTVCPSENVCVSFFFPFILSSLKLACEVWLRANAEIFSNTNLPWGQCLSHVGAEGLSNFSSTLPLSRNSPFDRFRCIELTGEYPPLTSRQDTQYLHERALLWAGMSRKWSYSRAPREAEIMSGKLPRPNVVSATRRIVMNA